MSLGIFANFFIDNEFRLKRMKDSFYSFNQIESKEWRINIRGKYKNEAAKFLKKELGNSVEIFFLNSRPGWNYDSRIISKNMVSDYIFFWIEDHILMSSIEYFEECIKELKENDIDQMWYSWFHKRTFETFNIIENQKTKNLIIYELNSEKFEKIRRKLNRDFYNISAVSVMKYSFFKKVLESSKPILKRWPRHLPFNFEKLSKDNLFNEIRHALPLQELFANIDDDHGVPGYSLISRGVYNNEISRGELKNLEFKNNNKKIYLKNKYIKYALKKFSIFSNLIKQLYYTFNILNNNK